MENREGFADYEVVAEVATDDPDYPAAALGKVTTQTALNAEEEPWVVWLIRADGTRSSGLYFPTFDEGWKYLGRQAKKYSAG